ncbi:hypothetical protein HUA76_12605 [Myxococcus sp. CA056]|uniref:hypothetical protein n=1 Tax=Myxococcus sp. CA056 TaxID=2741740 RepID=UPI00157A21C5|nr:hypothetical protein [Myxococcus sp. CA056]NTX11633.1 hypothetical protein [Myxococcus sp. CA056]
MSDTFDDDPRSRPPFRPAPSSSKPPHGEPPHKQRTPASGTFPPPLEDEPNLTDDSDSETEAVVPGEWRPSTRLKGPKALDGGQKRVHGNWDPPSGSESDDSDDDSDDDSGDDSQSPIIHDKKRTRYRYARTGEPEYPFFPPRASSSMDVDLVVLPCDPPSPPPFVPEMEEDEGPEETEGWFYATASKYEPDDTGERALVWLDLVEEEWFDERAELERQEFHRQNRWTPLWELEFQADGYRHEAGVPTVTVVVGNSKFHIQEGIWFRVRVSSTRPTMDVDNGPLEVSCYRQFPSLKFGPEQTWWVLELEAIGDQGKELARIYSIRPEDSTGQQSTSLNQHVSYVGVFDIGQGNCNALFDANGHPFAYFDFGLGDDKSHKYTRPTNYQPCMAGNPVVILSHFDTDHRQLAVEKPQAMHLPWLVIENKPVTSDRNFFNALTHVRVISNNQLCFEEYPWGFVLRADWPGHHNREIDKNEIGLAALVRVQDDSNAPPIGQRRALDAGGTRPELFPEERYVLLTGDAMFQHIASCRAGDLDGKVVGILAAHHGAKDGLEEKYIPLAAPPLHGLPPTVVYSYGIFFTGSLKNKVGKHGYAKNGGAGHPFPEAVDMYRVRGYHYVQKTAEDIDVTLINTNTNVLVVHPRHGKEHNDNVTLSGAAHAVYNAGPHPIHKLDEDHYTFPVPRDGTPRVEAGILSTCAVRVFDAGPNTWCFIRKPGHGLSDGDIVAIAGTSNDNPAIAIHRCDKNYVAAPLSVLASQLDADGTLNGAPAAVYHLPANHCLVRHERHGLDAHGAPQVNLNGVGLNPVTVLDEDHYIWPLSTNATATPTVNKVATAGVTVTLIAVPTGDALVVDPGPARTPGIQVRLRKYDGGGFPAALTQMPLQPVPGVAGYYTVDQCHHKNDSSPMRMELNGVVGQRRHCLLGWRGPGTPPVGLAATNIQAATTAYEQAAARVSHCYAQAQAATLVGGAAEAASKVTGNSAADVADEAETEMTGAAFVNLHPTAATKMALRDAILAARGEPNRSAASRLINGIVQRLRQPAILASQEAERQARASVQVVHTNGGPLPLQLVHCQKPPASQHPVAAKPVPEPVLGVGPRATGTSMPPGGGAPVVEATELLTFPAGECLVHHPAHGLVGTKQVRLRGTGVALLNGARNATVVDAHHYRLDASAGANHVHTLPSVGVRVTLMDFPEGQCLLHHPGQGATLGCVHVDGSSAGAWDGDHEVTEIIDADHYKLRFTSAVANGEAAQVDGTAVTLDDDGTDTIVTHLAHGRGLGPVVVTESTDPSLDGPQRVVEIVDANTYRTDKTSPVNVHATAKLGGVDVVLDADLTGSVVTHANHGRGLRMVKLQGASVPAYDGAHPVARNLDADWSLLDVSQGAAAEVTGQVAGNNVTLLDKAPTESLLRQTQADGFWGTAQVELVGSTGHFHDGERTLANVGGTPSLRTLPRNEKVYRKDEVDLFVPVTVVDHMGNQAVARHPNHGLKGAPIVTINGAAVIALNAAHAATVVDSNHYALPLGAPAAAVQNITSQVTRTPLAIAGPAAPAQGTPRHGVTLSVMGIAALNGHHQTAQVIDETSYELAITTGAVHLGVAGMADTGMGAGPVAITLDDDGTSCTVTHAVNHDLGAGTVTITDGNHVGGTYAYNGLYAVAGVTDDDSYDITLPVSGVVRTVKLKANGRTAYLADDGAGVGTLEHSNPHERVIHLAPANAAPVSCLPAACDFTNLTQA